jgi:hypothetical protein
MHDKDLVYDFGKKQVTVKCTTCEAVKTIPSLLYFKKWGYPKGTEELSISEWLHKDEEVILCPYCHYEAELVSSKEFYGKDYGGNLWVCHSCEAYVGTHKGTKKPLGTLANKETRKWRMKAHSIIDPLWKEGRMKRGQVYKWIQETMGLTSKEAHIGMFTVEQCKEIIRKAGEEMSEKIKVHFINVDDGQRIGTSTIPIQAIHKLSVGDRIEFKDVGALFGLMEIVSFAVNEGYPEGSISLKSLKPKGKIKLHDTNDEYIDSLLPF